MSGAGSALMGIGSARGEDRAVEAAGKAINSPLLEASMDGAQGVLLSIAGGSDLGLFEINEAASLVQEAAHPEANIIFGTVIDDSLGDEVRVTVIAAGFDAGAPDAQEAGAHRRSGRRRARRRHRRAPRPVRSSGRPPAPTPAHVAHVGGPSPAVVGGADRCPADAGRRPRVGGASGATPAPAAAAGRRSRLPGSSGRRRPPRPRRPPPPSAPDHPAAQAPPPAARTRTTWTSRRS